MSWSHGNGSNGSAAVHEAHSTTHVDADVESAIREVMETVSAINVAFRKDNRMLLLQLYDVMTYSSEVAELAERVMMVRPECQALEAAELAVDVLDPGFLARRVRELSPKFRAEQQQQQRQQLKDNVLGGEDGAIRASSTRASPSSLAPTSTAWVSATARALYTVERDLEFASMLALITAQLHMPEEEDHHRAMLEEFELKFQRPSELMRAVLGASVSAQGVCETYERTEGNLTPDVLLAALTKHPPRNTDEIAAWVKYVRACGGVPLTMQVAETLERCYVRCMLEEGAEFVFHRMTGEVGLVPLTTRPFALLFNSKQFKYAPNVLTYYELMLDYGIAPEPSLLRILCKQCAGMEFATLHFTLRLKSYEQQQQQQQQQLSSTTQEAGGADPNPPESRRKNERAYFEKRLEDMADSDPATPLLEAMKVIHRAEVEGTSLEGDTLLLTALLRLFCNGRTPLEDLKRPFCESRAYRPGIIDHSAAIREAAEAEEQSRAAAAAAAGGGRSRGNGGSSLAEENAFDFGLADGHARLEALDDTALEAGTLAADGDEDLEEEAHHRIIETEGRLAAPRAVARSGKGGAPFATPPLADDEEDDDNDALEADVLDDEDDPVLAGRDPHAGSARDAAARSVSGAAAATGATAGGAAAAAGERSRRTPRRMAGIASPRDEAAYVLEVLASYGSLPDNAVLKLLAAQYVSRGNSGIGVVQEVTEALFRAGHASRGAVEAVRSSNCHCLVRYYIRRYQRGRLTQLIRLFVDQCYEYNHVFRVGWAGDPDTRSESYYLRNNVTFTAFATAAMKAGPLDWALGLLVLALCMSSHPIADNTRARLIQVAELESAHSQHTAVISILDSCRWDRDRVLTAPQLMRAGRKEKDSAAAAETAGSVYTSAAEAQQVSSYHNPRGLNEVLDLERYMYSALREMNVSRDVIEYYNGRLREERRAARERIHKGEKLPTPQQPKGGYNRR